MIIERFVSGGTNYDLSVIYDHSDSHPAGPAYGAYVDYPYGGAGDGFGSTQSSSGQIALSKSGTIIAADRATLLAQRDALRAMKGRHGKLYATMDDDTVRWVYARCDLVDTARTSDMTLYQDVAINWTQKSAYWNGSHHSPDGWEWDSGVLWDEGRFWDEGEGATELTNTIGTTGVEVTNSGNATVTDAIITITPAGSTITALTISGPDWELEWTGSLPVGEQLVINSGKRTVVTYDPVLFTSTDAYDDLTFTANHVISDWSSFPPGTTTLQVARTGGDPTSTISFDFDDKFN